MKHVIAVAVLISTLALFAVAQNKDTKPAQTAAESWLALVDQAKYAESWDTASTVFKGAVTKEKWDEMVKAVRPPLGDVVSRKLKSAQYTTSLPGVPDGDYVVIEYDTTFRTKSRPLKPSRPCSTQMGSGMSPVTRFGRFRRLRTRGAKEKEHGAIEQYFQ
jgi:hypothetical protein